MNLKRITLFLVVGILGMIGTAEARTIFYGSETETITLVYGGSTLFRFPAEVKTISQARRFDIQPADGEQPNYTLLSVTPRFSTGKTPVAFILSDGTVIKTNLVVVSAAIPEKTDSIYDFKSKDSLVSADSGSTGSGLSEMELMKALIRGDSVSGYDVRNLIRTITPGIKGVEMKLVRIYTGNQFNGYIVEVTNVTKNQKLLLNVQNLVLGDPNVAILSTADNPVLEAPPAEGHKTYLRIVAKPTSVYNQIILPVEVIEKKQGQ